MTFLPLHEALELEDLPIGYTLTQMLQRYRVALTQMLPKKLRVLT